MTAPRTGTPAPTSFAPHHQRLFAFIVDYLLVVVVVNIAQKLLLGSGWDLAPEATGPGAAWVVASLLLMMGKDAHRGTSPGRWLTGIVVTSAHDLTTAPSWPRLLLRNLFLLALPVEAVLVLVDPYSRRLGDRVAGTVVVASPRAAPYTRRLLGLAILFLATMLVILLLETWNVRRSAAFPAALRAARGHPAIAQEVGEDFSFGSSAGLSIAQGKAGPRATVVLKAEGKQGVARVEVSLRLDPETRQWRLEGLQVMEQLER